MNPPSSPVRNALALAGFILVTFLAPAAGAFAPPGEWYAALNKPSWNPPSWVFGPAWTLLYTLMAVAAWRVWKRGGFAAQARPLGLYFIQLGFNAAWTPVFFGAQETGWALVIITLLWLAILLTLISFWRARRSAGWLLLPYLLWVTFASSLNFMIWRLNPAG